jgi:hypothetical protein
MVTLVLVGAQGEGLAAPAAPAAVNSGSWSSVLDPLETPVAVGKSPRNRHVVKRSVEAHREASCLALLSLLANIWASAPELPGAS